MESDGQPIGQRADAKIRLREVFRRYQVCSYYRDNAVVTLRRGTTSSADEFVSTAPLRVEFNHRRLNVDAYAVRIRVDVQDRAEVIAWFDEPETGNFDSQTLRTAWNANTKDRLQLDQVLADEVLRSRLSAGLAGPPPQLEWLLADEPMSGLFRLRSDTNDQFTWLDDGRINQQRLQRIEVVSDRDRFVFWIEPATSLIRRVEFPPPQTLPPTNMVADDWSLQLDLNEATFQPQGSGTMESLPGFPPIFVGAFVPVPPPPPSPLLGRCFDLSRWNRSSSESPYHLIANSPEDAATFQQWFANITAAIPALNGTATMHLVAHERESVRQFERLPSPPVLVWEADEMNTALRKLRLPPGSMAVLSQDGQLLLVETRADAGSVGNVFAVIRDHVSGIDVPQKIRSDYESILQSYQAKLQSVRP
ncbi:hypothetical protein [Neorhodopirellula pilleata]|nr:hypothetical protein [Neorhodopirellula pilleata]